MPPPPIEVATDRRETWTFFMRPSRYLLPPSYPQLRSVSLYRGARGQCGAKKSPDENIPERNRSIFFPCHAVIPPSDSWQRWLCTIRVLDSFRPNTADRFPPARAPYSPPLISPSKCNLGGVEWRVHAERPRPAAMNVHFPTTRHRAMSAAGKSSLSLLSRPSAATAMGP